MKFVVVPKNMEEVDRYYRKGVRHFLVGLEGFSTSYPSISLEKLCSLSKQYEDIFLFIAMNKMMFDEDLIPLEKTLLKLNEISCCAVAFYDLSILSLFEKNKFSYDLVWNQTHMVTNAHTAEYYYKKGVRYGILSAEITLEEMIEMKEKSHMIFLPQIFGRLVMAHSRRSLLTNYFESIEKTPEKSVYELSLKEKGYLLTEEDVGVSIFTKQVLNGLRPFYTLLENQFEFVIFDASRVEESLSFRAFDFFQIAKERFSEMTEAERTREVQKSEEEVSDFLGFFYQKTIYKVKKDER